jgi:hypothetical protein
MSQIPDIDRLLAADEANVHTMRQVFTDYSKELPELLNTASELYTTCSRAFGEALSDETRGLLIDNSLVEKIQAKFQRGLLLARIGVLYSTAVTDFLRMRLTMPLACVRLQCESLALIKLISENPAVAQQWMSIQTDKDGRTFFYQHQKRLKSILETYSLAEIYDQTSGVALHSRFIGLARGYRTARRTDGDRVTDSHIILAQEFDDKNPDYFMVQVFHVLHIQARIFANLKDAIPELNDRLLLETRIPRFIERVDRLFRRFGEHIKQRHPNIARFIEANE